VILVLKIGLLSVVTNLDDERNLGRWQWLRAVVTGPAGGHNDVGLGQAPLALAEGLLFTNVETGGQETPQ
jgi:hypothetical protein